MIFSALGRIPVRGEVVQAVPGFEFQILDADPRRIKRVRIMRKRALVRRRQLKGEGEPMAETQQKAITDKAPTVLLPAPSSDRGNDHPSA